MPFHKGNQGKNRKSAKWALEQRRARVADLYCQGVTQTEIARQVGRSVSVVNGDLQRIRAEWLASRVSDFDARQEEELRKLDALLWAAWEAFQRSQAPVGKCRTKRPGDPRFLERVQRCLELRAKVLGLVQPDQTNVRVTQSGLNLDLFAGIEALPDMVPDLIEERIAAAALPALAAPAPLDPSSQEQGPPHQAELLARLARREAQLGNGHASPSTNGNGKHD